MFCGNCGKEIGDTRFCPFCGSEQTAVVTLASDLPGAGTGSAPIAAASQSAPVQTAAEPITAPTVSATVTSQTVSAPAAPSSVPVPGAIPTSNLDAPDTEDHSTTAAAAIQLPEISIDLEKK
ncbi:MAG: hypothetical protein K2J80_14030, partial [Oscillospiraceae bacterium]|nr:hypothetical protein [Oscillospiraceae bacterium]